MILILGGTGAARQLFQRLQEQGISAVITVVTDYGRRLLTTGSLQYQQPDELKDNTGQLQPGQCPSPNEPKQQMQYRQGQEQEEREQAHKQAHGQVYIGALDASAISRLIVTKQVKVLVDATHPYALAVGQNARQAAAQSGIPYLRLARETVQLPDHPLLKHIKKLEELATALQIPAKRGTVFSTLGSKHLEQIVPVVDAAGGRLVVRVLPLAAVMEKCAALGIKSTDIVAMQGPFTPALNREIFKYYHADILLTKESGPDGGQEAKINAALELGMQVIVWRRPHLHYPLLFNGIDEVMDYLTEQYNTEVEEK